MRAWLRDVRWLSLLACIALVVAFVAPTARMCVAAPDGHRVCSWVLDQTPSTDDWRSFAGAWEAARISLRDFHQWPSWNPYHCGGVPLYQDPQTPVPALVTGLPACALSAQASSLVEQDAVRQSTYAATTPVSNHPS